MSTNVNSRPNSAKRLKLSLKNRKIGANRSNDNEELNCIGENNKKQQQDPISRISAVHASLANLGNTCFMNSVLNILRYSPGFRSDLHNLCELIAYLKHKNNEIIPLSWELVSQLHEVFTSLTEVEQNLKNKEDKFVEEISSEETSVVYPRQLLCTLRQLNPLFDGNYQHDAHELLCCFLNYVRDVEHGVVSVLKGTDKKPMTRREVTTRLKRNVRLSKSKQTSISNYFVREKRKNASDNGFDIQDSVTTTFESHMMLHTRCAECENSSKVKEVFLNVSVSPHTHEEGDSSDEDSNDKSDWNLLREAILDAETLSGDNKYWCDFCRRYNEATRSLHFLRLPPILIIQLKRFSSSYNSISGTSKVSDFMPTPHKLGCLLDQCPQPCSNSAHSYRLYGIINHSGISLTSGHYTALVEPTILESIGNNHRTHLHELLAELKKEMEQDESNYSVKTRRRKSQESSSVSSNEKQNRLNNEHRWKEFCCSLVSKDASWLQYDDEKVNIMTNGELESLLNSNCSFKNSSWTPYLLFYSNDLYNNS